MQKMVDFLAWCCLLVVLGSCSRFQKVQKLTDPVKKYEAALAYYKQEDYYRAGTLLEELIPLMRGKAEGEQAQFYYAYCHYHQRQLVLSTYYFKSFYETFPRSPLVEEARYMHAVSLFKDTPEHNLDQTNSYEALTALEQFLNRHPESERTPQANQMIRDLREKLELKAYENARLYHRLATANITYLKAAIIAFDNFVNNYPSSQYAEEILYLQIETEYELAKVSTDSKKEERYYQTLEYYESFIDRYPESRFARPAENIYQNTRARLVNLTSQLP